jgi:voltage-gated potassium channel Kch
MAHLIPNPVAFAAGLALALVILLEAFEAIILPRRVTRKIRVTRFFYRSTWAIWKFLAGKTSDRKFREALLGGYGPISLLLLIAIWAFGLVLGFAMMQYGAGSGLNVHEGTANFALDVYLSATTFFTLGIGDVVPRTPFSRALLVAESGLGYGFLAVIVGYLPFIYSSFSRREVNITLLDARAGTPPTAGELLRRHSYPRGRLARLAERMGNVVRRINGKPPVLSRASLLPLATRQSIVDCFPHRHSRHLRAGKNRHRRRVRTPGRAYFRHRAPCRCGSLADFRHQAQEY